MDKLPANMYNNETFVDADLLPETLLNTSSQNETNVSEDQISVNAVTGNQYSKNIQYLLITQAQGELESWVDLA